MILLIDNYDSFVFNLARYCQQLGRTTQVVRNDKITLEQIIRLAPETIILSPGPCTPNEAGICLPIVKKFSGSIPLLGICLGHQVIGQAFGGQIIHAQRPMHGKSALISHQQLGLFRDLPNPLKVARYHSLVVDPQSLPQSLEVLALSHEQEIMALGHRQHATFGVQFHPESILTEQGYQLLENFLLYSKSRLENVQ